MRAQITGQLSFTDLEGIKKKIHNKGEARKHLDMYRLAREIAREMKRSL